MKRALFIVVVLVMVFAVCMTCAACGLLGGKGEAGVGIESIEKTGTKGLVDTYTITMTDGSTSTFTVTNGKDGADGAAGKDGADGASFLTTSTYTPDEYFRFNLLDDDTYEVFARCNDMPITVVIPSTYNGKPVSKIAERGFCMEDDILYTTDEYVVSDGITSIGGSAFRSNEYLKKITLPKSLTIIGSEVFSRAKLEQIIYKGTKAEWNAISKNNNWNFTWDNDSKPSFTIHCTDGDIECGWKTSY